MKLYQQDLEKLANLTLQHYNRHAEEFWEGTRDHDVSQYIAALLRFIESEPPFMILDFGCGPGRDLKAFAERGHIAVGLEGASHTAAMARAHSGCEVWQQDFLKLDLPRGRFDGVFANAALFHVPSQELPRIEGTARESEAGWRAVQLEPARPQRGRVEPRALRRVS
jgi:SAM-dependent methyltransferase